MTAPSLDTVRAAVHRSAATLSPNGATITDSSTLGELRFDSLDVVELQLLIEMELSHGRSFGFDDVTDAWNDRTTIGGVVTRTCNLLGVRA
jgi:hypothetical protein